MAQANSTASALASTATLWIGLTAFLVLGGLAAAVFSAEAVVSRDDAKKAFDAGNFKDAYEAYRKLALDPQVDPRQVGSDLQVGIQALTRLARTSEVDAFREAVAKVHEKNWRLLAAAAESYLNGESYGFIVAGKFHRGQHRGGGKLVNSTERDRVRALQLYQQGLAAALQDDAKSEVSSYLVSYGRAFMGNRGHQDAWRLQTLTDLAVLPDYDEGWYYGRQNVAAPVDEAGNPVFYRVPKSLDAAANDGERWRWCLAEAIEVNPAQHNAVRYLLAQFWRDQFGEQTMAYYGFFFGPGQDDDKKNESGTYALHTLGEDETIARLATGIKRFKLPDEFNYIHIFKQIADEPKTGHGEAALTDLAQTFENRRQYPRAAEFWRRNIKEHGPGQSNWKQARLDQIVGNWGRFEPLVTQPAGKGATIDFRFRNGNKVVLEAHEIKVEKLLDDVKAYLKAKPAQVDWRQVNIGDLGYRLVQENQKQYVGAKVAGWDLALEPREQHFDKRITIATPLQKAGAYLVSAQMADGNVSKIIVWVSDTALVKKQLPDKALYYVADAVSGKPLAKANLEFFGWQQKHIKNNQFQINTLNFAEATGPDGTALVSAKQLPQEHQWLVMARGEKGRFAYLGFSNVWFGAQHDAEYDQTKVFVITDRPVYRPTQSVKFKFWVRHAKYDQEDTSSFADKPFNVEIQNPKGEKVLAKGFTADKFGGFEGEMELPSDATLGVYQVFIPNLGGGNFRVEEYKKPEFEVTVDAPKEPIMLGEKITATVKAKYFFGAPVAKAKVKYKVLRSSYTNQWYPTGRWDWFYGPGYWWFAGDYLWYPGWSEWGCRRPTPWWWWGFHQPQPPEVVAEREVEIGPDGVVKVEIDTAVAKEIHPDEDHKYSLTAEVVDESRRTIVGSGDVLVARKPFKVFAWVDRGYYRVGDTVRAEFKAQTLDQKPVAGEGHLKLLKISYDKLDKPTEKLVREWKLNTDDQGYAEQQLKASEAGQYRLSFTVTDSAKHTIEGGYLFSVIGDGSDANDYRFNEIELTTDKREYAPGEKVKLMVSTNRAGGTVLLFVRPANGVYLPPKVLRLDGRTAVEEIEVSKKDMPNFFVEALTISGGKIHVETKEIVVPPEKRVLNVAIAPSAETYKPGAKAKVQVKLTDFFGKPFVGSTAITVYDKSVDYIAGGSNVPEIKAFFWKWRRSHNVATEDSLNRGSYNLTLPNLPGMSDLGVFGASGVEETVLGLPRSGAALSDRKLLSGRGGAKAAMAPGAAVTEMARRNVDDLADVDRFSLREESEDKADGSALGGAPAAQPPAAQVQPTVRTKFADTAFWTGSLTTDAGGVAEISLDMPENLTTWKVKAWGMGHGTRVGEGTAEVITRKDLIVRMQAPRFFVEKDEVVLSANVHNYLDKKKSVEVVLELDGKQLAATGPKTQTVEIAAGGEARVDWRVNVAEEGEAVVRMKALTDEESDAMEMRFPVYVHGMLKTDSWAGAIRPDKESAKVSIAIPKERRINQSHLEIRYSPTLAGAMVDALPYLVDYPYDSTDQTLNRFLPTVLTQKILLDMELDLKAIQAKRTNLNAQEIGDDAERAKQWKRYDRNPVFDQDEVRDMVKAGVQRLTEMQLSDGGWGWFWGFGEHSSPHTTAYVMHGLQLAAKNDVALVPGMLDRGVAWLKNYQDDQVLRLKNAAGKTNPWKEHADEMDAFVFMVLVDADVKNQEMLDFLYRDRTKIAVYAKAMYGLALDKLGDKPKLEMVLKNISQFVMQDEENQTAWLNLPAGYWWYWYGSEYEAHAYYLKLLARTEPKGEVASRLVKYLVNNRKHATYWNATRDTAIVIEALAEYLKASGEDNPDLALTVLVDGKPRKEVKINAENLFTFDNKLVLEGDAIESGVHEIELRKTGRGPVYFNVYSTNFTLEDFITKAGLEIKVNRKYYKLNKVDKKIKVTGSRGQAVDQKVEKYDRQELSNLAALKSGDLVEIELEIDSKNDYEYLMFEDMKAAGFEPVDLRSGYNSNSLGAYMELRDNRVVFFARTLARGKHSVSYRMRAETPGKFSALPTRANGVYAPELRANSDELKLTIED